MFEEEGRSAMQGRGKGRVIEEAAAPIADGSHCGHQC